MNCNCNNAQLPVPKPQCGNSLPQVIEINNPPEVTLFHKTTIPASVGDPTTMPPETLDYKNVLLVYEATGEGYLYSSDGIPTLVTQATADINAEAEAREQADLQLQQSLDTVTSTLTTQIAAETKAREAADKTLTTNLSATNAEVATLTSNVTELADQTVVTSTAVEVEPQAVSIQITSSSLNGNGANTTTASLPIATASNVGLMSMAQAQTLSDNTAAIQALQGSAVVVSDLPADPTQAQLTAAWASVSGKEVPTDGAVINDTANLKLWTYYGADTGWVAFAGGSTPAPAPTIETFTTETAGTILGSTQPGQIAPVTGGVGQVNGWVDLVTSVAGKQDNLDPQFALSSPAIITNATDSTHPSSVDLVSFTGLSAGTYILFFNLDYTVGSAVAPSMASPQNLLTTMAVSGSNVFNVVGNSLTYRVTHNHTLTTTYFTTNQVSGDTLYCGDFNEHAVVYPFKVAAAGNGSVKVTWAINNLYASKNSANMYALAQQYSDATLIKIA